MINFRWLAISVLWLTSFLVSSATPKDDDDDFPFTTVVDCLWQNAEFSTFLRVLQKEGLIPYLNELDNFTIFAPINSAFVQSDEKVALDHYLLQDYILNFENFESGTHVLTPNDSRPHLIEKRTNGAWKINNVPVLRESLRPSMQNAVLYSVTSLIRGTPELDELVEKSANVSLFSLLLDRIDLGDQRVFDNKTLIIPKDSAFNSAFNGIELEYLLGPNDAAIKSPHLSKVYRNRKKDRRFLFQRLLVDGILGGNIDKTNALNLDNELLTFESHNNGTVISVNNTIPALSNQLYATGIAHIFSELDFLPRYLNFTAEKYLVGLGADRFVEETYMRKLDHLINGSHDENLTIFVLVEPSNEGSGFSKSSLLYHFVDDYVDLTEYAIPTSSKQLYDTMFCSSNKRLGGECQRLKIERHSKGKEHIMINGKYCLKSPEPITIGNTSIYLLENDVSLPADLLSSIDPFSGCSKSLHFLDELNLLDLRPNNKGYTVLLPCFDSWDYFDLNLDYLEHNITALNLIMKNYILNGLIYTDSEEQTLEISNFYNEPIRVEILGRGSGSSQFAMNLSTVEEPITLKNGADTFFDRGVLHPMEKVFFPKSLDITLLNLLETTKSFEFLSFLETFPEFDNIVRQGKQCSILVPTSQSLLLDDISLDSSRLKEFLELHIIPANSTEALLNCQSEIQTLHGEYLHCRESSSNTHLLRFKKGLDKEVRILRKGCASADNHTCVFVIDQPLSLSWLDQARYQIGLPGIAFAVGMLLGVVGIFSLLSCTLMLFMRRRNVGDRNDGEVYNEQERLLGSQSQPPQPYSSTHLSTPPPTPAQRNSLKNETSSRSRVFENSYSMHSSRNPVSIQQNRG
ncbi:LAQU0S05e00254g1_1 [Lachancea quebecensis]|uniref:LAQU0S05e00254g1_1 n=1 Tax=Lachancea quebecensis TaxID=1654605 RepID=A0A0N7MLG4_9SACH|nr:LAQU0S05e00254g1_1 [Lachancea quebecensis]